jgi:cytidylate kinase
MDEPADLDPACRPTVVAIDGPAGAGKSTVARLLARRLGVPYLDTGAMYRTAGLLASRSGLEPPYGAADGRAIARLVSEHNIEVDGDAERVRVTLDGEDVSEEIRSPKCSRLASAVSTLGEVRQVLVELQRRLGARGGGVLEGRDIGTVVFPDADLKVFITAAAEVRARRRWLELEARGVATSFETVLDEQRQRDRQDSTRSASPLQVAEGALVVDTSQLTPEEVVERILSTLGRSSPGALDSTG